MFAHVFSGRAPVTIRKRGMAILKLCDHLEDNRLEAFPMTEITFYRYLCSESAQGAPHSRLQGLLEAIAFCRHVLDVTELQVILKSKRCSGAARETNLKERNRPALCWSVNCSNYTPLLRSPQMHGMQCLQGPRCCAATAGDAGAI